MHAYAFQVVSFLQVSPSKLVCTSPLPIPATYPAYPNPLDLITRLIFGEHYFSLLPRPLKHKYSPQQPILKHPQPTFLPKCERSNTESVGIL